MLLQFWIIYCLVGSLRTYGLENAEAAHHPWLINYPGDFHNKSGHHGDSLVDFSMSDEHIRIFESLVQTALPPIDSATDGEVVDALEHFFWGQTSGLSIELGALDGSAETKSQTVAYMKDLHWRRILIEGNPSYRAKLLSESSDAFVALAAICSHQSKVHYAQKPYVGGILEFMALDFFKGYHGDIYQAGGGNLQAVDWTKFPHVQTVDCVPLAAVLHKAHVKHVNYFILDVEGGELEVLRSINWTVVKFDVLCVETDPENRPKGYAGEVTAFLLEQGYQNYAGQIGRNTWYVRKGFTPKARPGAKRDCFNGVRKAAHAEKAWNNPGYPAFQPCALL